MEDLRFGLIAFTAMLPVINPVGTALIIYGMTGSQPAATHRVMSMKIALYSFCLLAVFFIFGHQILSFFGVTVPIVEASGGLVLFLIGWNLLSHEAAAPASPTHSANIDSESSYFYPYTFPMSIGPGCLAVGITLGAHSGRLQVSPVGRYAMGLVGLGLACLILLVCLLYLRVLTNRLKAASLMALSKILAFFVICIGAQIFWNGLSELLAKR